MHPSTDDGTVLESIETQLQAQHYPAAVKLLARHWARLSISHGDHVRSFAERLPESEWAHHPDVLAAIGSTYLGVSSADHAAALPWLHSAERLARRDRRDRLPGILLRHAAALRALGRLDDAEQKVADAREGLDDDLDRSPRERIALQSRAAAQLGLVSLHRGRYEQASRELRLATALGAGAGTGLAAGLTPAELVECHAAEALLHCVEGDHSAAGRATMLARGIAGDGPLLHSHFGAPALIAEALIATRRLRPAEASALGDEALVAARRGEWQPFALYAQASASLVSGRSIEGLDQLRRADEAAYGWQGFAIIRSMSQGLRAAMLLQLGELDLAELALQGAHPGEHHEHCTARHLAAVRLRRGDPQGCLDALAPCRSLGEFHSVRTVIDVLLLTSAARYELAAPAQGDLSLDRALYLAGTTGMRAPFLAIPAPAMRRMLGRAADRNQPAAVHELLDELRTEGESAQRSAREPLSDRELVITQHLSLDKTVGQIAAELFISANTVKTHVRSIYRKLDASSRKEALRRIRELGLDLEITPG